MSIEILVFVQNSYNINKFNGDGGFKLPSLFSFLCKFVIFVKITCGHLSGIMTTP